MDQIGFKAIGIVESDFKNPKELCFACEDGLKTKTYSCIKVFDEFSEGIKGLEEFSHAFVLFHLDKVDKVELITHPGPPSVTGIKKVGVFASRSQYRPNPIALRLVKVAKVEGNKVFVEGLDAVNNSNVLDIKPYVSGFDRPKEFSMAEWYDWMK